MDTFGYLNLFVLALFLWLCYQSHQFTKTVKEYRKRLDFLIYEHHDIQAILNQSNDRDKFVKSQITKLEKRIKRFEKIKK